MRLVHQCSGELVFLISEVPLDDRQVLGTSHSRIECQPVCRDPVDVSFAVRQRVVQQDDPSDGQDAEKGRDYESDKEAKPFVLFGDDRREGRKGEGSGSSEELRVETLLLRGEELLTQGSRGSGTDGRVVEQGTRPRCGRAESRSEGQERRDR